MANQVDGRAVGASKRRWKSGLAAAAWELLRSSAVQGRKVINRARRTVLEVSSLALIVAVTTLAPGCDDSHARPPVSQEGTPCQPDECAGPAPGGTVACDDLSVAGTACMRQKDGSCGWAELTCPASLVTFVKPDAPVGACVLSYNTALVDPGVDACCAWVGGPNTCDAAVACNDRSGMNCCLIYATSATVGAEGCCLYDSASGSTGLGADRKKECGGLLAGP
jgi:hypothetical protein